MLVYFGLPTFLNGHYWLFWIGPGVDPLPGSQEAMLGQHLGAGNHPQGSSSSSRRASDWGRRQIQ